MRRAFSVFLPSAFVIASFQMTFQLSAACWRPFSIGLPRISLILNDMGHDVRRWSPPYRSVVLSQFNRLLKWAKLPRALSPLPDRLRSVKFCTPLCFLPGKPSGPGSRQDIVLPKFGTVGTIEKSEKVYFRRELSDLAGNDGCRAGAFGYRADDLDSRSRVAA